MEKNIDRRLADAELRRNILANGPRMHDLFLQYDLSTLKEKLQQEQVKEIYDAVLAENDFRIGREDYTPMDVNDPKPGDRITSDDWSFLLSDDDFERLQAIAAPRLHASGVTDEEGRYRIDCLGMKVQAFRSLVEFIISRILPESMKKTFAENKDSVVPMEKLINAMRPLLSITPSVDGVPAR